MSDNIPTNPLEISVYDRIDVVVSAYIQPFSYEIYATSPGQGGGFGPWVKVDIGGDADTTWTTHGADLEGKRLFIAVAPTGETENSVYDINVEVIRVSGTEVAKLARWTIPKGTPAGSFPVNVVLQFS